ncbi:MAG: SCP2 sterol-binding domain-containing protein [archaeon]|nr:SCP2 sterol-binding domain-containing protein [archaeon]
MSAKPLIQHAIDKFNRKISENKEARDDVELLTKTVNISLDDEVYSFKLEKAEITDFKSVLLDNADISIATTVENLKKLIDGTLRPMRAYVTKKIIAKGNIQDLLHLKKFFD